MEANKIYHGSALEVLKTFPDECIDMCMTSPPYWGLRDYDVEGQLGLEKTFQEYIGKLCDIFNEVKRVLKPEGTCWVNLGDSYAGNQGRGEGKGNEHGQMVPKGKDSILKDKCLYQIPSRFSIEMTNRGWILRNEIIWCKPNCMPSSVKDRFTVDFEKMFFFSKNKKYYFEKQFEQWAESSDLDSRVDKRDFVDKRSERKYPGAPQLGGGFLKPYTIGKRNKRCVWDIPTTPWPGTHYAVYPENLCKTPIMAGCPEYICNKCGKAREKIYKKVGKIKVPPIGGIKQTEGNQNPTYSGNTEKYIEEFIKYSDCNCNAGFSGGVILDPFMGVGTTGLVAIKLNRNYVGIELNPKDIKSAMERIGPELSQERMSLL